MYKSMQLQKLYSLVVHKFTVEIHFTEQNFYKREVSKEKNYST